MSIIEDELLRRLEIYDQLKMSDNWPLVTPQEVRDLKIYGGASGVWVDKQWTRQFAPDGIAMGILHTGRHYDDDVDESGILYHYPSTLRPTSRDDGEIQSLKNAKVHNLPIFVIQDIKGRKKVNLAWLSDFDDSLKICLLTFETSISQPLSPPVPLYEQNEIPLFGPRRISKAEVQRAERDPKFKFQIMQRFQGTCVLSSISVTQMLDAAHIIPVANRGTESIANGLLLSASLHRAFDSRLWAINPETLKVETKSDGPSVDKMRITNTDLSEFADILNVTALQYRYEKIFHSN